MDDALLKPALARAVVNSSHVHLADGHAVVGKPTHSETVPEPRVDVIREGNLIRAVEIICTCGERIRLRFDYE